MVHARGALVFSRLLVAKFVTGGAMPVLFIATAVLCSPWLLCQGAEPTHLYALRSVADACNIPFWRYSVAPRIIVALQLLLLFLDAQHKNLEHATSTLSCCPIVGYMFWDLRCVWLVFSLYSSQQEREREGGRAACKYTCCLLYTSPSPRD